jgi:hypothetical protein
MSTKSNRSAGGLVMPCWAGLALLGVVITTSYSRNASQASPYGACVYFRTREVPGEIRVAHWLFLAFSRLHNLV